MLALTQTTDEFGKSSAQELLALLQAPPGNMSEAVAALQHHLHVTKLGRDELERWVHQQSIILQIIDRCSTFPGLVHVRQRGSILEKLMLRHILCSAVPEPPLTALPCRG